MVLQTLGQGSVSAAARSRTAANCVDPGPIAAFRAKSMCDAQDTQNEWRVTHPTPLQCDSPKVVTRNSVPKVLIVILSR